MEARRWLVGADDDGARLDRFLGDRVETSRNRLQRAIAAGAAMVRGKPAKASTRLHPGDEVELTPVDTIDPAVAESRTEPEDGPLDLLFVDDHLAVIDKPAGLTVHPGAGRPTGTLANRLVARWPTIAGVGHPGRPGIVHRLDKDTTGVMVVARTDRAYLALARAFAERTVRKTYLAVVYGATVEERGSIDRPIGRHATERKKMTVRGGGRKAVTHWHRLAEASRCSLLAIGLETGRTHQVRVHMKASGHPLVGDPIYGEARWRGLTGPARRPLERFERPALHAWRLAFRHPVSDADSRFEAPVPADMITLWRSIGGTWPDEKVLRRYANSSPSGL